MAATPRVDPLELVGQVDTDTGTVAISVHKGADQAGRPASWSVVHLVWLDHGAGLELDGLQLSELESLVTAARMRLSLLAGP